MKISELLNSCTDDKLREWASNKSWQEIYNTCHRGDWLLWLFASANPEDIRLLTLVKGHCANTVRHLMRDNSIVAAVDAAIAYGEGKISDELLASIAGASFYHVFTAAGVAGATLTAVDDAASFFAAAVAAADTVNATVTDPDTLAAFFAAIAAAGAATFFADAGVVADIVSEATANRAAAYYLRAFDASAAARATATPGTADTAAFNAFVGVFAAAKDTVADDAFTFFSAAAVDDNKIDIADVAIAAAAALKKANQRLTANIVRQYLPIDKWDVS